MYARIFSRRSATERKFPRRNTRRARTLNQISTWFSHDVCFGTYTNRTRWLASARNAFRVATDFSTPLVPFFPSDSAAIPRAILQLGLSLGLSVIAEGVENEAQRQFLAQQGCEQIQGLLIGAAMPAAKFEDWVKQRREAERRA